MFNNTGCEECRDAWSMPIKADEILQRLASNSKQRQADLYQYLKCKTYGEENNGSYPSGITEGDARNFYSFYVCLGSALNKLLGICA